MINYLSKQKHAMCQEICKPRHIPFKRFDAQLTDIKNYLPLFPDSSNSNNMVPEEINKILLHAFTNVWSNQSYLQGWGFDGNTYKETCDIFERMQGA